MNQKHNVTVPGLGITFSTGTYASLANGAVNVRVGETNLLVTACVAQTTKPGQDWFPLTVDYRETLPRRLLQTRRPPQRKRNPHLATLRPPLSPAISRRFLKRSPNHRPTPIG